MRTVNDNSLNLIKSFEGLSLQSYPDPCSPLARVCHDAGVSIYRGQYKIIPAWETIDGAPWTIGYGATHHEDGSAVFPGEVWTEEQALTALEAEIWSGSGKYLEAHPDIQKLNDDQYGALCSFAYNAGIGSLYKSEMLMLIRLGKPLTAVQEAWLVANIKRNRVDVPGLVRRRRAEASLFASDYNAMEMAIKG